MTSEVFLSVLYLNYLRKTKQGLQKSSCNIFPEAAMLKKDIAPMLSIEEINNHCKVLQQTGKISASYFKDTMMSGKILDSTIVELQEKFPNGNIDIINFIKQHG